MCHVFPLPCCFVVMSEIDQAGVSWVTSRIVTNMTIMTIIYFKGLGKSPRIRMLQNGIMLAILWILWLERNGRIFENKHT